MRHQYTTCDRCNGKIEGHDAAVLQLTRYNGRGENELTRVFDLCSGCYSKVIELVSHPPQPQPFT